MPKKIITPEDELFIKENYLKFSSRVLAEKIGCSRTPIQKYMKKNNLIVPKATIDKWRIESMIGRTNFTKEEDEFIIENYLKYPVKTLGKMINRSGTGVYTALKRLNLVIPKPLIEKRKKESQFEKGSIPFSKGKKQTEFMSKEAIERTKATRFKKGNIPPNAFDEDGVITIRYDHKSRSDRKYKWIRVSLGNWEPLHKYNWEKINGPVPRGYCLWFIDGDSLNCEPNNLELITRKENIKRNTIHHYPQEVQESIKLINKIKKELSNHD